METRLERLSSIFVDPSLQPRVAGIDPDHVRELEAVTELWPPLRVAKRDGRYVLIDGFHRYAAAQNLKLESVPVVELAPAEGEDLHALAFALNAEHGRPLTLSDRRAFAARLLRANADWSDREIGRRCGLAQPTIAKVRQELERRAAIPAAPTRVGRDGRARTASTPAARGVTALANVLETVASALDRTGHRQIVRYLAKLADVLEEQNDLRHYDTVEDAAQACRAVLGEEKARELAERLGWSSDNILQIAQALGYTDEDRS